jgi:hypothetical protein
MQHSKQHHTHFKVNAEISVVYEMINERYEHAIYLVTKSILAQSLSSQNSLRK